MKVNLKDGPLDGFTLEVRGEQLTVPMADQFIKCWVYSWPDWRGEKVLHDEARLERYQPRPFWGGNRGVTPSGASDLSANDAQQHP